MAKDNKIITTNGRAAFYASMWPDFKDAALKCGWALGLHGSLASDMDIMAMPWTEEATPAEEMIKALSDCFTESPFSHEHRIPHKGKPNGRIVYTMSIWADFYLDINIIDSSSTNLITFSSDFSNTQWKPSAPQKNTLENKKKFFALYWGQKVRNWYLNKPINGMVGTTYMTSHIVKNCYLGLKPLTSIKDEDLKGIYPHDSESFFHYYGANTGDKKIAIEFFLKKAEPKDIDLLRLRGFAVPWGELSVEDQVYFDWVKLV